jgi:hypothetical protein
MGLLSPLPSPLLAGGVLLPSVSTTKKMRLLIDVVDE